MYKINLRKKAKQLLPAVAALVMLSSTPALLYAATDTENTVINANIGSTISVSTSGTVALNITPVAGGSQTSASDTVTVSTNNASGYTLTLADADSDTDLLNGAEDIPAHSGTQASPTALANNTWGYRVDTIGGFGSGPTSAENNVTSSSQIFAGVPVAASPNTIRTTGTTASGQTTTVWYGAKADTTNPNGTYTDTVTYTATTQ